MRKFFPIVLMLVSHARAQQIEQYTQYVFNHFAVNPAVAGSKDCIDVHLGFRKQWVGFPGAPTTGWATICGTLKRKGKPFKANRSGIGAFIEADQTGPLGYSHFYLAYAYHIQLASDRFMSLGFFAGIKQMRLNQGDVIVFDNNDPAIAGGSPIVWPEIAPGIWIYNKSGWLGLSMFQALGNHVSGLGVESYTVRQTLFSWGHRYKMSKNLSLLPSTLMKFSGGSPLALDVNVMAEYRKKVGLGVSYRNQDAVAFMIKLPLLKFFSLGYSYDITTSKLRTAASNTHEIILSIYPCSPLDPSKAIVRCPVFE